MKDPVTLSGRRRRLGQWLSIGTLLVAAPFALYFLRHIIWGKSLYFYDSTGLRMPRNAKIVAVKDNYPLPNSNEGESLLVFDVKAPQVTFFLARAPWKEDSWHRGSIPQNFLVSGADTISPYYDLWQSPRLWYTAYGKDKGYYDGELLVVDPETNRVYLLDWNH